MTNKSVRAEEGNAPGNLLAAASRARSAENGPGVHSNAFLVEGTEGERGRLFRRDFHKRMNTRRRLDKTKKGIQSYILFGFIEPGHIIYAGKEF